jgi:hypothetical protein
VVAFLLFLFGGFLLLVLLFVRLLAHAPSIGWSALMGIIRHLGYFLPFHDGEARSLPSQPCEADGLVRQWTGSQTQVLRALWPRPLIVGRARHSKQFALPLHTQLRMLWIDPSASVFNR